MNRYVRLHRRLSIMWSEQHTRVYGEWSDDSMPEYDEIEAHRLNKIMRVAQRVEDRLDQYATIASAAMNADRPRLTDTRS